MDTPKGTRPVRSPGFKVEKHNDGKSVRLFHITAVGPGEAIERHSKLSLGYAQTKRLVSYNTALEQEGFFRIAINNRDPLALTRYGGVSMEVAGHRPLRERVTLVEGVLFPTYAFGR
jgi:hypothetical protein